MSSISSCVVRAAALALFGCLLTAGTAAAQDVSKGEKSFKRQCGTCHTVEAGKNRVGPSLAGIVGRKAGTVDGYAYSPANKNSGVTWDDATLNTYLEDPAKFMPGTKMVFTGIKKPDDRADVIAYLKTAK